MQGHIKYDVEKSLKNDIKKLDIIRKLKKQNNMCCHCCENLKIFNFEPNDPLQYSIDRSNNKLGHIIEILWYLVGVVIVQRLKFKFHTLYKKWKRY
jgi:hypothetical protein